MMGRQEVEVKKMRRNGHKIEKSKTTSSLRSSFAFDVLYNRVSGGCTTA
jgi:hypothetical protein